MNSITTIYSLVLHSSVKDGGNGQSIGSTVSDGIVDSWL